jgi:hypothetical protein
MRHEFERFINSANIEEFVWSVDQEITRGRCPKMDEQGRLYLTVWAFTIQAPNGPEMLVIRQRVLDTYKAIISQDEGETENRYSYRVTFL